MKVEYFYKVLIFTIRTEDFAEIQNILSNDIHGILARIYLREATSYRWHMSVTIRDTVTLIYVLLYIYFKQRKGKCVDLKELWIELFLIFLGRSSKKINLLLSVEEEEFLSLFLGRTSSVPIQHTSPLMLSHTPENR